jgi:hypothetical protein
MWAVATSRRPAAPLEGEPTNNTMGTQQDHTGMGSQQDQFARRSVAASSAGQPTKACGDAGRQPAEAVKAAGDAPSGGGDGAGMRAALECACRELFRMHQVRAGSCC